MTPDGHARVSIAPKDDPGDNDAMRRFARAVLAVEPSATEGPITILEASDMVVHAFIEAGVLAVLSIAILLWLVLKRIGDVLLTLIPLTLAGVVTLELTVLVGLPLNFANIIALPLLLGVGVAFKIYYIMAWREGQTNLLQTPSDPRRHLQRADHGHSVRQSRLLESSGHLEHGQAAGAFAGVHAGGGGAVSTDPDGQAAKRAIRKLTIPRFAERGPNDDSPDCYSRRCLSLSRPWRWPIRARPRNKTRAVPMFAGSAIRSRSKTATRLFLHASSFTATSCPSAAETCCTDHGK